MDIRIKWFYRLGFLFLLFIVFFIFMKLKPMWGPAVSIATIILLPFFIGAFISYLLHPIVEALHRQGHAAWLIGYDYLFTFLWWDWLWFI